jgi:Na+(H+)/acetate symporter ActP
MDTRGWTLLFVGTTFVLYLTIAWLARVRDTQGFYVAGRGVPAIANGMATASDWMSASSFISMAGLISFMGYAGGVYLMGWTGGYVLLALLLAPYLRKFGHFTVPDFVGDRFDSNLARIVAVICALFISFIYVAGQMRGVGVVFSRFLEVDINVGVFIGMAIVFVYATLGGMKSITWTQVAQYWVLITAFLVAAISIAIKLTGIPIPSLAMGATAESLPEWYESWERTGLILWFDDGDGRVHYSNGDDNEIFRNGGLSASELLELQRGHGAWIESDGARGADARPMLRSMGLSGPDQDIIVLATPEMAELASWIVALIAAGGLAAALSTASGLLLVISSAVAHDLFYRVVNPAASEAQRLLVGRTVIAFAVVIAGLFGIYPPGFVSQVVAFAFGLAAASLFPVLIMGIFSKRVGTVPAVAGMIVGISFTAGYIYASVYGGMPPWTFGVFDRGINPQGIGIFGMALNFAVTLALTPLFPAPSAQSQAMVDSVREPEGFGPAARIEQAVDH